jgi:hypothetical protein
MMKKTQPFEFTLELEGVDENTPFLEDHLFEAGHKIIRERHFLFQLNRFFFELRFV